MQGALNGVSCSTFGGLMVTPATVYVALVLAFFSDGTIKQYTVDTVIETKVSCDSTNHNTIEKLKGTKGLQAVLPFCIPIDNSRSM